VDEQGKKKVIAAAPRARMAPQMSFGIRRHVPQENYGCFLAREAPEFLAWLIKEGEEARRLFGDPLPVPRHTKISLFLQPR
jgi:hypothetical protein